MDDEADDLEAQKYRIEEQIRKKKRANAKARKEEEERILIAAAEGNISSDITQLCQIFTVTGPRKAKEKAMKDAGESFKTWILSLYLLIIHVSMV